MIGRIVEIANNHRHLSLFRGFLLVESTENHREEMGRIPIADIAAVIANAHGISYTNNILVALAERGAPFVLCGANHNVVGILLSIDGNYNQAKRFDAQIIAKRPLQKRLWADLVACKLRQQDSVLEAIGLERALLKVLAKKVKSGDPENLEAQGARMYWTSLFGADFRRDTTAIDQNVLLNYGYTVLRACTARAVVASGLHPTIGLFHQNTRNTMRLVDDLMEPYRPFIDLRVWQLLQTGTLTLTPETKKTLVDTMFIDIPTSTGVSPLMVSIQELATSLAQIYLGERDSLQLPLTGLALSLHADLNAP